MRGIVIQGHPTKYRKKEDQTLLECGSFMSLQLNYFLVGIKIINPHWKHFPL